MVSPYFPSLLSPFPSGLICRLCFSSLTFKVAFLQKSPLTGSPTLCLDSPQPNPPRVIPQSGAPVALSSEPTYPATPCSSPLSVLHVPQIQQVNSTRLVSCVTLKAENVMQRLAQCGRSTSDRWMDVPNQMQRFLPLKTAPLFGILISANSTIKSPKKRPQSTLAVPLLSPPSVSIRWSNHKAFTSTSLRSSPSFPPPGLSPDTQLSPSVCEPA